MADGNLVDTPPLDAPTGVDGDDRDNDLPDDAEDEE